MGILSRMSTVFKAKMSRLLDQVEDPRETLEYSYQRQLELLQGVKRGLADVAASKKRLELQAVRLRQAVQDLEEEARQAVAVGRDDLARAALERKAAVAAQLEDLQRQIGELDEEQKKMEAAEVRLAAKVEAFRTQKEVIRAQYSAAEAQVKIGEAATGLSEEMADVGLAVQRAQEKTEAMKARAAAIDELVDRGALSDVLADDPIARELRQARVAADVEAELARLKAQAGGGPTG